MNLLYPEIDEDIDFAQREINRLEKNQTIATTILGVLGGLLLLTYFIGRS